MKNPYLIGERIYLAPIDLDNIDYYLKWLNDQEVTQFLNIRFPLNREAEQEHLERLVRESNNLILGIHLKEPDQLIGNVGLHRLEQIDRRATFGIVIGDKEAWSKGYGTEATKLIVDHGFRALNLNRIELEVFEFNLRGMRCYEKVGFVHEGTRRQAVYRNGQYYDCIEMGLLRREWEQQTQTHEKITIV